MRKIKTTISLHLFGIILFFSGCMYFEKPANKIIGESLVLIKNEPAKLALDHLVGAIELRSACQPNANTKYYKYGVDYTVDYENGTISRTSNSSIPDYSTHIMYGKSGFKHLEYGAYSKWTNTPYFVYIDYSSTNSNKFAAKNDQSVYLTKTRKKLESGDTLTIAWYGDSITAGGEASSVSLSFTAMYVKFLKTKFHRANISSKNVSVPGYSSAQGIESLDAKFGSIIPDLVFIGFGMNDHNIGGPEPELFKENLKTLANLIRSKYPAEVVLFSAFPPNDNWYSGTHRMQLFAEATKQAAIDSKCAYVDVYAVWSNVLIRKTPSSLLSNNINHPNDFGHWLYLQAFEAMIF